VAFLPAACTGVPPQASHTATIPVTTTQPTPVRATPTTGPQRSPSVRLTSPPETRTPSTAPADVVFHNGSILTMETEQPEAQALAIQGETILAVGSDDEILALQGPETSVVDLAGRTVLPGFVDGHTHVLRYPDRAGKTLDEAMGVALSYGLTTVNEMSADGPYLEHLMEAEQEGRLRLRVNVFPEFNAGLLNDEGETILMRVWFPEQGPILDPDRRLRIPGIKIFVDGGSSPGRGCPALSEPYPEELLAEPWFQSLGCGELGELYLTQEQVNRAVADAQAAGFRVAFHAMGDRAIDATLDAIEYALNGASSEGYRHQIQHSSLMRPDQMQRYVELDVLASVRGYFNTCDQDEYPTYYGPDRFQWAANRYALPRLGIHTYAEGDFGWTTDHSNRISPRTIDPLLFLYGAVTHQQLREDGTACQPQPWIARHQISVEQGLRMLTIEPAFAVSQEDVIGSLTSGKFADLVILSDNPLTVDPNAIIDLRVLMTMVAGRAEFCAPGYEVFCPSR
jgi:predicted amidohydrolase YtcJ